MDPAVVGQMLLIGFVVAAALLWASVFGYVAVLVGIAAGRRRAATASNDGELPAVAVVVAVHDEERYIGAKLDDLRRTDYPHERLTTLVVDGGSTDRTATLVETARAGGAAIELLQVDGARGKADQLNAAFADLCHDIIVVTDVDSALDPACIRELVGVLLADPSAVIVGAWVRPATRLLEERMHWWLLNSLWWLEGEALAAAGVAGVCFALRRSAVVALPSDCTADDIYMTLSASGRGGGVRLCRRALATELRVPQTVRELLRFRRRRGAGYVRELLRARPAAAPWRWHFVRLMRLCHFLVTPGLAAATGVVAAALCATPHWRWVVGAALAFAAPALATVGVSTAPGAGGARWWRLGIAAGRLAALTWLSLLVLSHSGLPPLAQEE
jgi:cellulose synthase/poly-beta-1,6-N-acetylglucosamine synthase-like glycosyltransferase